MLSDRHYQLLTAYVDGEMDAREREAALRLLEESAEARSLLQELQRDAQKIQRLPRARLDAGFAKQVVAAVRRPAAARRFHPIGIGVAAAVLLAVVGGAWILLNSTKQDPVGRGPIVQVPREKEKEPTPERKELNPRVAELIHGTFEKYAMPVAEIGKRLAVNDPALIKQLASLPEPAAHLEIRCRDAAEVLSRLQKALSDDRVKLWVDLNAQRQLARGEQADYVVLAENLPPTEVAKLIAQASAGDQFDSVLFNPLQFEHRKELSALLGVSTFRLELSRFDAVPVDRQPDDVGFSQSGQPVRPKPSVAPAPTVPVERVALVVSSTPDQGRGSASNGFLNSRRGNRPGTMQVVIILHQIP